MTHEEQAFEEFAKETMTRLQNATASNTIDAAIKVVENYKKTPIESIVDLEVFLDSIIGQIHAIKGQLISE